MSPSLGLDATLPIVDREPPRPITCAKHGGRRVTRTCGNCGAALCDGCVRARTIDGVAIAFCKCSGIALRIGDGDDRDDDTGEPSIAVRPLLTELLHALRYPATGSGPGVLAGAVVFLSAASFLANFNLIAQLLFAPVCFVFSGYLLEYLFEATAATCDGGDVPPTWPDFRDLFESMLGPLTRCIVVAFASFAIAVFALGVTGSYGVGFWLTFLPGLVIFPAAFAEVATQRSLDGLAPRYVLSALYRSGPFALVASAAFLGFCFVVLACAWIARAIPYAGVPIGLLVLCWSALVTVRVFGLIRRRSA